jgi:hypothetical protein
MSAKVVSKQCTVHAHVTLTLAFNSVKYSSVSVVVGYRMDESGSIPGRGKRFFCSPSVQADSEAYSAAYPTGTEGSLPGDKVARV